MTTKLVTPKRVTPMVTPKRGTPRMPASTLGAEPKTMAAAPT
jgi:hypothetical protein